MLNHYEFGGNVHPTQDTKTTIQLRHSESIIVMQWTGLYDKNEKEIWEGDICKWESGILREIIWDERNACFGTPMYQLQVEKGNKVILGHHLEVVGDKYTNPELLNLCEKIT